MENKKININIPRMGQRIIKTTVAVLICLFVCYALGYSGAQMPSEACITAIICMQPLVRDTRQYAISRVIGTLIGSVWGLLLLLLFDTFPLVSEHTLLIYFLMAVGTMLSIYTAVAVGKSDASGLAAIVFLCIVISFPDIDQPLVQAAQRIVYLFLGTAVAIVVNMCRLPRKKNNGLVFFVRIRDLVADRSAVFEPAVQFRLSRLIRDGARICLVSEHAPAFFSRQFGKVDLETPMIVMDGAAIYSTKDNCYLWSASLDGERLDEVRAALDDLGYSYFIYTIRANRIGVYHSGEYSEPETVLLKRLRSSTYRDYLEGAPPYISNVVYVKIVAKDEDIADVSAAVHKALPERPYRILVRSQGYANGLSGLYIYSSDAVPGHARSLLMDMLAKDGEDLDFREPINKEGYRSESDALRLIAGIEKEYEPIDLTKLFRRS
ncbi:MAG: FUSC family protein [Firmicutes bacterium]|nr:FUSC family protein [Bacillota bacterium]